MSRDNDAPRFVPAIAPPADRSETALWFVFHGRHLLTLDGGILQAADLADLGLTAVRQQFLGRLDGRPCYSAQLADDFSPSGGMRLSDLRQLYGALDEPLFWVAGRAVQIVDWDRNHQFCGRCASRMGDEKTERAKRCPSCGLVSYPRISPAIIVAVIRDDQILLAHGARHPAGFYSVLAGFVEPGETLEECVMREVKEEVSIDVREIRYFGSQPWPFPNSLMVGFTAVYAGGQITPEAGEIDDAGWFRAGQLPERIPGPISISRRLIDWFASQ